MAGERTPDTSPGNHKGSSDDDISLREHMQRQIDVLREGASYRIETVQELIRTEVGHINRFNVEQDRRYEQRFGAQEKAVEVALSRRDMEFHEHLRSVRDETLAALEAADKAIHKSETATEKRFECVAADTPILCADLIWRPAGDLRVGDELVAFDEESQTKRGRRYCRSTVTENSIKYDELFTVNTSVGSVRCNQQHPWLVRRKPGFNWEWIKTADLQPGYAVMHALDTWAVDRSWSAGWLAGMFDGEGCLTLDKNHRSQLSLSQRESPTSDNIITALKSLVSQVGVYRLEPGTSSTPNNTVPFIHFVVTRVPDVLRILGTVRPPRLLAKADSAWNRKPLGSWGRASTIESIEAVGSGQIACLSTSTHTYIADGFAMHNSVNEFRAQLADQANTFARRDTAEAMVKTSDMRYQELIKTSDARYSEMKERFLPRAEHEARISGLAEKVDVNIARLAELELRFSSRLDLSQGASDGGRMSIMDKRSANGAVLALVGMGITVVLAVITIVGFIIANMSGG